MTELDTYLAQHYLDETQLAAAAAMTMADIDALIQARLVPAPAYVVDNSGNLCSFVFGAMAAPGPVPAAIFRRRSWPGSPLRGTLSPKGRKRRQRACRRNLHPVTLPRWRP